MRPFIFDCPMIVQCAWCNPYCSERIKLDSLKRLERDWWRVTIYEGKTNAPEDSKEN